MIVESVRTVVTITGLDEDPIEHGDVDRSGYIRLRPEGCEISYEFSGGGRWRVRSTLVRGSALHRRSGNEVLYMFGDHRKPLWVVGLEFQHYPRENPR